MYTCGAMTVRVVKFTITYSTAGTGCFSNLKLEKRNELGYYNETMFYESNYGKQNDCRIWERALSVSLKDNYTCPVHISGGMKDSDGNLFNALIVLVTSSPL